MVKTFIGLFSLVISVASIFIPLFSEYGIFCALIFALIHSGLGGIILSIFTVVTCVFNILFFSPVGSMGGLSIVMISILFIAVSLSIKHAINLKIDNILPTD
ncbi:MAG: hypothetical protein HON94_02675 [Methylococcales bacterium]|jgi:hypothetical protein|nr:hypothetical protein [Methylococcales bacterium]MBT7411197.1 hypothetical protein [Methylococcales bacterium]